MSQNDDLISRQAVINALAKQMPESYTLDGSHPADEEIFMAQEIYADCIKTIEQLPAVQPDHVADIGKKADGDCISRQAVVKFFNDWISCLDENCHHQSVADMIIIKNDFKNLPSVQPESKWIPVSERLPDEGQKCLVSDKGAIGIDTYIGHGNPYNWKWYTRDYEAWMPLPEAYEGGDSE